MVSLEGTPEVVSRVGLSRSPSLVYTHVLSLTESSSNLSHIVKGGGCVSRAPVPSALREGKWTERLT